MAGINYFLKVQVEGSNYAFIRAYQPLPKNGETQPSELAGIQYTHGANDEIHYFEGYKWIHPNNEEL